MHHIALHYPLYISVDTPGLRRARDLNRNWGLGPDLLPSETGIQPQPPEYNVSMAAEWLPAGPDSASDFNPLESRA